MCWKKEFLQIRRNPLQKLLSLADSSLNLEGLEGTLLAILPSRVETASIFIVSEHRLLRDITEICPFIRESERCEAKAQFLFPLVPHKLTWSLMNLLLERAMMLENLLLNLMDRQGSQTIQTQERLTRCSLLSSFKVKIVNQFLVLVNH